MKKIVSSLLSVALSCSMIFAFVSNVSAATVEATPVNPQIIGKVTEIRSGGRAVVEFSLNSDAEYGVEYDESYGEYTGETASGFSTIQVNLTLSDDVDTLFSAINGVAVMGQPVTVDGKSVTYAFGVSNPYEFAQNGDVLFRLNCTLNNAEMTLDELKTYKLVESFDNIVVYSKVYAVSDYMLGDLLNDTKYRTDGNGDYDTVTGVFEYTQPAESIDSVVVSPATATVAGEGTQQFTVEVTGTAADKSVTWSTDAGSITQDGLFTAPAATDEDQTVIITATSNFDNEVSGKATVTVPAAAPVEQDPTTDITGAAVEKGVYFDVTMNGNGEAITDANVVVAGPTEDGGDKEVTFKVINYGDIEGELSFIIGILTDIAGEYTGTSNVTTGVGAATDSATVAFPAQ